MINWGRVPAGSTIPFFFDSFAGSTGASITMSGILVGDIEVYKGTSMTQRASDAGYVLLDTDGIDVDGTTGIHGFSIDTADNTDSGFYAADAFYTVVVASVTVDTQTVNFVAGTFYLLPAVDISDVHSLLTAVNTIVSDIQSDTNKLVSDATEVDTSDLRSALTIIASQVLIVKSDTSDIISRLVVINSETTDIQSETEVIQSLAVAIEAFASDTYSDTTAIHTVVLDVQSETEVIQSDTLAIEATLAATGTLFELVSDIYSDTTAIEAGGGSLTATQASQLARVQSIAIVIEPYTSDTVSMVTIIKSDTSDIRSNLAGLVGAGGILSDINSGIDVIQTAQASQFVVLEQNTSDTESALVKIYSDTTVIESDTVLITGSQFTVLEQNTSDTESMLVLIRSDTTQIESDVARVESKAVQIYSDTTAIHTQTTAIASDTTTLASDLAEGDFSDILSRLVVTNSQILVVKSDTSDIKSHLTVLAANISDINSDTDVLITVTSDIQSDTNKLVSDATEVDTSDILSLLTLVRSDTAHIESDAVRILSDTTHIDSKVVQIYSDTTHIDSDTTHIESDAAHIESQGVVVKSQVLIIKSDTSDIISALVIVQSDLAEIDTSDIQSLLTKVYSDTTAATNARGEPGQGSPAATLTAMDKIDYLYKAWRNRHTQTSTEYALYADDAVTKDQEAVVSDDTTTFERGEITTGA